MPLELPVPSPPIRANVQQFASAPYAVRIWAPNTDPTFDASTITSAVITVTRLEDGSIATWIAAPLSGAASYLGAFVYTVAIDGSDFATPGEYDLAISYITPSGPIPGEAVFLYVQPANRYRNRT